MTTSEIRNKLVEIKTLHNQSKIMLQQAITETKEIFSTITEDDRELLRRKGYDVTVLETDVDAIKTQEDSDKFVERLRTLSTQLHQYLEMSLEGR